MFDNFRTKFKISANNAGEGFALLESAPSVTGFAEFMGEFSGCTFNDGLYRVHTAASSRDLTPLVIEQFPKFKGRILPFGYDWIGRQFAVDFGRRENGEPLVLLLEADTGDALGIPQTFMAFHESEIVEYDDALLA